MIIAAVIDIGTNSVKLTVAELSHTINILREESRITRLGRGVDRAGTLDTDAAAQTLTAIKDFVNIAHSYGAERVVAAGTSALRDVSNGQDFINSVMFSAGVVVDVIAGEREAELAYRAVTEDPVLNFGRYDKLVVFDIGGGSTELIDGVGEQVKQHVSLNIGAVRLTERHFRFDPPTDDEFRSAVDDARSSIKSFGLPEIATGAICGVGGTATTFAALVVGSKDVHGKLIKFTDFEIWINKLRRMSVQDRKQLRWLAPARADIIVGGGAVLLALLTECGSRDFTVCIRGMRYGLLLEQLDKINNGF